MAALAVASGFGTASAQTIHEVPPIPGGGFTRIYAVSSNGNSAAGYSDNAASQDRAIRWTFAGGTQDMGFLPGGVFNSYAQGIDDSGTILCGWGDSGGQTRAFRWTTSGGYQLLPFASGTSGFNRANGISGNGNVITGVSGLGSGANGFTWDLVNTPFGVANVCAGLGTGNAGLAVSNDGLTIVGTCGTGAAKRTYFPTSQLSTITGFPGQQWQMAEAVSATGSFIVGRYSPSTGGEFGFRYGLSVPGFVQAIPPSPGGSLAIRPRGVNTDGTVVVGQVFDNNAGLTGFIYTPSFGTQIAATHLAARAVNLAGWTITDITAVSPDGRHMAGYGIHNGNARGFVIRNLPCPGLNSPIGALGDNGCIGGTAVMGVNFSFQVGADASNRFRWFKNGVQVFDGAQPSGSTFSGATTQNLTIANMQTGDAGSYTVEISALGACATLSAPYAFNGPAVVGQNINPGNVTACLNQNPSLFASPSAPSIPPSSVTYRWQKFVGASWVNLSDGATGNGSSYFGTGTSTFSIFNVQPPDAGQYRCMFGVLGCGTAGQVPSAAGSITVIDSAPAIVGPFDTTGCPGDNDAFLSVLVNTCAGCTYQWQKYTPCPFVNCWNNISDGPTGNGGFFGGTTTPNLTLAGLYSGDFTQYRCIVTIPCIGAIPSNEATVSPTPEASFTSGPTPTAGCLGGVGSLTVAASPPGTAFQWQKYVGPCINCWQNIANGPTGNGGTFSGAQSATLTINTLTVNDTLTSYRCIATGPCGLVPAVSAESTFALLSSPVIQTNPVGGPVCPNGTKQLTVTVAPGNYGTVTYQWWRFVPAFPIFQPVSNGTYPSGTVYSGAQSATLTASNFKQQDAGQYYCFVIGSCGQTPSGVATLTFCQADFNCSGTVSVQDLFDFLAAWFAGNPNADVNGMNGVSVQDIFDFMALWFAGC